MNKPKSLRNYLNYADKLNQEETEIILEDIEFIWKKKDIELVKKLWEKGVTFKRITEKLDRDPDEVFLLLLHLARKGSIKKRSGYIWGKY